METIKSIIDLFRPKEVVINYDDFMASIEAFDRLKVENMQLKKELEKWQKISYEDFCASVNTFKKLKSENEDLKKQLNKWQNLK
jgi:FtsZ-binding cell division protein ZapB